MRLGDARERLEEWEEQVRALAVELRDLMNDVWKKGGDSAMQGLFLETREASRNAAMLSRQLSVIRINMLPRKEERDG